MEQGPSDPTLKRLCPARVPASVSGLTAGFERDARARAAGLDRPLVALNMVSSVDGRATIARRSGGLSSAADRALFHGLRASVDAVLVGAGTARTERYGRMIRDPAVRHAREQSGRSPEPLACIVSSRLALDPEQLPLLRESAAQVVIVTASERSLPPVAASVQYVRASSAHGTLDVQAALRELRARLDVRIMLCEGGPSLNAHLFAHEAVDELFLSLAPVVAGGSDPLRIVGPADALQPVSLTLADTLAADSHLFMRYRVGAADPLT